MATISKSKKTLIRELIDLNAPGYSSVEHDTFHSFVKIKFKKREYDFISVTGDDIYNHCYTVKDNDEQVFSFGTDQYFSQKKILKSDRILLEKEIYCKFVYSNDQEDVLKDLELLKDKKYEDLGKGCKVLDFFEIKKLINSTKSKSSFLSTIFSQ